MATISGHLAEFGYGKYLIVPFWYALAAYQAGLVSPWVFGWTTSRKSTNHGSAKLTWYAAARNLRK